MVRRGTPPPEQAPERLVPAAGVVLIERHTLLGEALGIAVELGGHRVLDVGLPPRRPPYDSYVAALVATGAMVVVADLEPTDVGATDLLAALTPAGPSTVVLTASTDPVWWGLCLHHGAHTVIAKSEPLSHVLGALHRIASDRPTMTPGRRQRLLAVGARAELSGAEHRRRLALLSDRERAVLAHLMAGHHAADIARHDVVSPATVRAQIRSVLAKLEVSSQLEAVALAHRAGWRDQP
ncbi:LuxR C-terminal-related transcriptional regulator [Nocardioides zeae]|uniref:LuxR C-terminal-related transcriptional regulator n=1 Tax=Nocardioides imazamoxiresistens TaxID=3231893 RepID=A0ABU3PUM2_9ACTN|nr:LuxR C-terminal-related transcriptional regulator [Nocardioides zeae]MDT9592542.1 LuxR C-terminal-related transcriptional regulator [Nocardioides zeae]